MDKPSLRTQERIEDRVRALRRRDDPPNFNISSFVRSESQDFLSVLLVWKYWIIAAVVVGAAIGFFLSLFIAPTYESRAVLQVGYIRANMPIEPIEGFIERLKEEHRETDKSGRSAHAPFLKDVRSNRNSKALIVLTAQGGDPSATRDFLGGVTAAALESHNTAFHRWVDTLQTRLKLTQKQLDDLNAQSQSLTTRAKSVAKQDAAAALVLMTEKTELLNQIVKVDQQRFEVLSMSKEAIPSTIVRKPTISSTPVAPSSSLYLATGAFIGLIVGIFVALLMNRKAVTTKL